MRQASSHWGAQILSPVRGLKIKGDQDGQGAEGILVALASEFWGLGRPRIYNEVATRLLFFAEAILLLSCPGD